MAFVEADGYISGNTSVLVGTELKFQIKISPNSGSQSPLAHFNLSIIDVNGNTLEDFNPVIEDPTSETIIYRTFSSEKATTFVVTATVTDESGKANIAELTVGYIEPIVAEIGLFKGKLNITGHITTDGPIVAGSNPIDEQISIPDVVTKITLGSTEDDKINAMIDIDGTPVVFQATRNGNNLVFDEFDFYKYINLYGVSINLNFTINMTGVLEDDTLTLSGTATGSSDITILINVHVNLTEGVITGLLNKVEE